MPSKFTAEDFLSPEKFRSGWPADGGDYGAKQYAKGLQVGKDAVKIAVAVNDVWSANMKDGGHLSSCEKLGYHAGTSELLRGFLDSGAKIVVYRENADKLVATVLVREH